MPNAAATAASRSGGRRACRPRPPAANPDDDALHAFGLVPLALGIGAGAELQRPLALAVIGGLALSTPVTLLIVPGLYQAIKGRVDSVTSWSVAAATTRSRTSVLVCGTTVDAGRPGQARMVGDANPAGRGRARGGEAAGEGPARADPTPWTSPPTAGRRHSGRRAKTMTRSLPTWEPAAAAAGRRVRARGALARASRSTITDTDGRAGPATSPRALKLGGWRRARARRAPTTD